MLGDSASKKKTVANEVSAHCVRTAKLAYPCKETLTATGPASTQFTITLVDSSAADVEVQLPEVGVGQGCVKYIIHDAGSNEVRVTASVLGSVALPFVGDSVCLIFCGVWRVLGQAPDPLMACSFFDACVGPAAEQFPYQSLEAAVAAGACRIGVLGDTTLATPVTLTQDMSIFVSPCASLTVVNGGTIDRAGFSVYLWGQRDNTVSVSYTAGTQSLFSGAGSAHVENLVLDDSGSTSAFSWATGGESSWTQVQLTAGVAVGVFSDSPLVLDGVRTVGQLTVDVSDVDIRDCEAERVLVQAEALANVRIDRCRVQEDIAILADNTTNPATVDDSYIQACIVVDGGSQPPLPTQHRGIRIAALVPYTAAPVDYTITNCRISGCVLEVDGAIQIGTQFPILPQPAAPAIPELSGGAVNGSSITGCKTSDQGGFINLFEGNNCTISDNECLHMQVVGYFNQFETHIEGNHLHSTLVFSGLVQNASVVSNRTLGDTDFIDLTSVDNWVIAGNHFNDFRIIKNRELGFSSFDHVVITGNFMRAVSNQGISSNRTMTDIVVSGNRLTNNGFSFLANNNVGLSTIVIDEVVVTGNEIEGDLEFQPVASSATTLTLTDSVVSGNIITGSLRLPNEGSVQDLAVTGNWLGGSINEFAPVGALTGNLTQSVIANNTVTGNITKAASDAVGVMDCNVDGNTVGSGIVFSAVDACTDCTFNNNNIRASNLALSTTAITRCIANGNRISGGGGATITGAAGAGVLAVGNWTTGAISVGLDAASGNNSTA